MNIANAIKEAVSLIDGAGISRSPETDAYVLLCHCLGRERLWCHLNRGHPLDKGTTDRFFSMVKRRAEGEPVAYIRGKKEFWSRDFAVNPHTLIPRPETELIIEHALSFIKSSNINAPLILDPGTGSGIIGITLAAEIRDARVTATDIDFSALQTAQENAKRHGVLQRIDFIQAEWLTFCRRTHETGSRGKEPFPGFDIVACNPPYVSYSEQPLIEKNVKDFEPHKALFSPDNGFFHIKELVKNAPAIMRKGGLLLCEIGWTQGEKTREIAFKTGRFKEVEILKDYSGNDRLLKATTR